MEPGLVSKIAAESTEEQTLREQLSKKAAILEKGLATCKRYVGRTALSTPYRFDHNLAYIFRSIRADFEQYHKRRRIDTTQMKRILAT